MRVGPRQRRGRLAGGAVEQPAGGGRPRIRDAPREHDRADDRAVGHERRGDRVAQAVGTADPRGDTVGDLLRAVRAAPDPGPGRRRRHVRALRSRELRDGPGRHDGNRSARTAPATAATGSARARSGSRPARPRRVAGRRSGRSAPRGPRSAGSSSSRERPAGSSRASRRGPASPGAGGRPRHDRRSSPRASSLTIASTTASGDTDRDRPDRIRANDSASVRCSASSEATASR